MPALKNWPPGVHPRSSPDPAEVAQGPQLLTPLHSRRGLGPRMTTDDVSLDKLPQTRIHRTKQIHVLQIHVGSYIYTHICYSLMVVITVMRPIEITQKRAPDELPSQQ